MKCQKRTDVQYGNPIIAKREMSRLQGLHRKAIDNMKPSIDTRCPPAQPHLTTFGRDYFWKKRTTTEAAFADLKMIQSIARTMTRSYEMPIGKGPTSLNATYRKQELFKITMDNHKLLHRLENRVQPVYSSKKMAVSHRQNRRYMVNSSYSARKGGNYDAMLAKSRSTPEIKRPLALPPMPVQDLELHQSTSDPTMNDYEPLSEDRYEPLSHGLVRREDEPLSHGLVRSNEPLSQAPDPQTADAYPASLSEDHYTEPAEPLSDETSQVLPRAEDESIKLSEDHYTDEGYADEFEDETAREAFESAREAHNSARESAKDEEEDAYADEFEDEEPDSPKSLKVPPAVAPSQEAPPPPLASSPPSDEDYGEDFAAASDEENCATPQQPGPRTPFPSFSLTPLEKKEHEDALAARGNESEAYNENQPHSLSNTLGGDIGAKEDAEQGDVIRLTKDDDAIRLTGEDTLSEIEPLAAAEEGLLQEPTRSVVAHDDLPLQATDDHHSSPSSFDHGEHENTENQNDHVLRVETLRTNENQTAEEIPGAEIGAEAENCDGAVIQTADTFHEGDNNNNTIDASIDDIPLAEIDRVGGADAPEAENLDEAAPMAEHISAVKVDDDGEDEYASDNFEHPDEE